MKFTAKEKEVIKSNLLSLQNNGCCVMGVAELAEKAVTLIYAVEQENADLVEVIKDAIATAQGDCPEDVAYELASAIGQA